MNRRARYLLIFAVSVVAFVPLLHAAGGGLFPWLTSNLVAGLNLLGWSLLLILLLFQMELSKNLSVLSQRLHVESRFTSLETMVRNLCHEIQRRYEALGANLLDASGGSEELSTACNRITRQAYRLLRAESVELALFDRGSGLYHSSFVLGRPMSSGSQAMLGASDGADVPPNVIVEHLHFANESLGTIRVGLPQGRLPTRSDQEIMRLLALQASVAIVNAEYTSELVRMKQASEESVKAKTGFLANLSHEIRGPLGIMLNAVELVLDGLCGPINDDQLGTLKMVRANGNHLLELINDVLDYAKSESGKIVPQKVDIFVDDLLQDITAVVRAQADAKGHKLVFKSSEAELAFSADRRHARQMLINLLTNAIKYTPDGGRIEVWADRLPGSRVRLNVRDTGVGIDPQQRHKVFTAFERVDQAYSINQNGTGLGMPLTKRLCEANGGSIDFSSVPGEGSHFWVIFSIVDAADHQAVEAAESGRAHAAGRGEALLVIEREDGERDMLVRYLDHIGFQPVAARSTLEAMEKLNGNRVSLIILDNNILDTQDLQTISLIRKHAGSVPVIVLSSRAFVFDIERYLKSDVDRCILKPVPLIDLGHSCRELLDGKTPSS